MSAKILDRRDFSRLSLAAFGGAVTGATALGQQSGPRPIAPPRPVVPPPSTPKPPATRPPAAKADGTKTGDAKPEDAKAQEAKDKEAKDKEAKDKAAEAKKKEDEKPKEIHLCRGLNTCKEKGTSGKNKCAGQGDCATTLASPHECATGNACKNQGGCGPTAGKNQCNGLGDGGVPLLDSEWPRLRKAFEARMKRLNRPVGPAPLSVDEQNLQDKIEQEKARYAAEEAQKQAEAQANGGRPTTPSRTAPGRTAGPTRPGRTTAGDKDAANTKERPKPGTVRPTPRPPAKSDEDTKDILGELTDGDKEKKAPPAPKK